MAFSICIEFPCPKCKEPIKAEIHPEKVLTTKAKVCNKCGMAVVLQVNIVPEVTVLPVDYTRQINKANGLRFDTTEWADRREYSDVN